jgi:multicomponent Na+:H+ antiporter subunit D
VGAVMHQTGKNYISEIDGLGRKMPVIFGCFTVAAVSLTGIPPFGGFISKWHLAIGSLESGIGVFSWLGPVILLISALLTAGYLLPITVHGFLPGSEYKDVIFEKKEPVKMMLVPLGILGLLTVILGIFPNPLTEFIQGISSSLL